MPITPMITIIVPCRIGCEGRWSTKGEVDTYIDVMLRDGGIHEEFREKEVED